VLILEPGGERGQAWRAAAGMLAPQIEADENDRLLRLGLAGRDHYPPLMAALQETTGIDSGLWLEGIARVAGTEVEAAELRAKVAWQREQGLSCDWLGGDEVRRRWPWLGPTAGALWADRDGALDPASLVRALVADAQRLGAILVADQAMKLDGKDGRITGVTGTVDRYSAGDVVLAAGAWSSLVEGLPRELPVRPVRGQMVALPWPAAVPRAIVYNKDCYLLARGGEAVVGSTMEEAGFRPEVTPEGIVSLMRTVMSLCPGLVRAKIRRSWAGLRPMTPDGLPIIGGEPRLEGLWYATGHGRNGILLAGITGVLVRQLVERETPDVGLQAFGVDRF
jgi:glycine oxidase